VQVSYARRRRRALRSASWSVRETRTRWTGAAESPRPASDRTPPGRSSGVAPTPPHTDPVRWWLWCQRPQRKHYFDRDVGNYSTARTRYRPGAAGQHAPPPADGSSTVAYGFVANLTISTYMYINIAADLRPSADGSAVRTSLVAGGG